MNQAERDERLETWSRSQPLDITEDPIWRLDCYREAAYLFALARDDALVLRDDRPFGAVGEQLLRCAGSIAANVAEAYGRPTSGDDAPRAPMHCSPLTRPSPFALRPPPHRPFALHHSPFTLHQTPHPSPLTLHSCAGSGSIVSGSTGTCTSSRCGDVIRSTRNFGNASMNAA